MNSPRTTRAASAERAVVSAVGHAPRCRARAFATSAGKSTAGWRHRVASPRLQLETSEGSAIRTATLAHLLHASLTLGEVLVEDHLLIGSEDGAKLRIHLLVDRVHLLHAFGAIAAV